MKKGNLYPKVTGGILAVAVLAALTIEGGWIMLVPALLTVAVVHGLRQAGTNERSCGPARRTRHRKC